MEKQTSTTEPPLVLNLDVSSSAVKDGVGVYCKCGMIIYAATKEAYARKETKAEIDRYWDMGYRIGRISQNDVKELFGCKCG